MKSIFLFIWVILSFNAQAFENDSTVLKGRADFLQDGDTVRLYVDMYGSDFITEKELHKVYVTTVKNSGYKFSILLSIPAYFTLILSDKQRNFNLFSYLIEPGFNVTIKSTRDSFQFSGKDAIKLNVQNERRKIRKEALNKVIDRKPQNIHRTFAIMDSSTQAEISYLKRNKELLGNTMYAILYGDAVAEAGLKIDNFLPYNSPEVVEMWRNTLLNYKNEVWEKFSVFDGSDSLLQYSSAYASALIAKYRWDSCIMIKKLFGIRDCYEYFRSKYKGSLRERILTTLLYKFRGKSEDISECLISSFKYVIKNDYSNILKKIQSNLTRGSIAYKFHLPDTNRIIYKLSDFAGKVVLLDFWFTGCTACVELKPKMDSIAALYKEDQIVFITISIDKNRNQWLSSIRKRIYTSDHSINLYTEGIGDAHPIISYYLIAAYPRLILIDKEGKLCNNPVDPRLDNGRHLIDLINQCLKL